MLKTKSKSSFFQSSASNTEKNTSYDEHGKIRELQQEEERMKLRMLQADAGLIASKDLLVTAERMDWMYSNPIKAQTEQESEDFLLGKPIPQTNENEFEKFSSRSTIVGSIFNTSITSHNEETIRKIREDPLFTIRQVECNQRKRELARKKIYDCLQQTQAEKKKITKKEDKETLREIEKRKKKSSYSRASSPSVREKHSYKKPRRSYSSSSSNYKNKKSSLSRWKNKSDSNRYVSQKEKYSQSNKRKEVFEKYKALDNIGERPTYRVDTKVEDPVDNNKETNLVIDSEKDYGSDDLAPPEEMASSIKALRASNRQLPLLFSSRKSKFAEPAKVNEQSKSQESAADDTMTNEEKLNAMKEQGILHEKDLKKNLEKLEKLQKIVELSEAAVDLSVTPKFVNDTQKALYVDENLTLEDRLKRYAARRQAHLRKEDSLDD